MIIGIHSRRGKKEHGLFNGYEAHESVVPSFKVGKSVRRGSGVECISAAFYLTKAFNSSENTNRTFVPGPSDRRAGPS